jgi:hemoglobin
VDQICQLAGGPCFYIGRDMKTSHAGLGITESEWQINLGHARPALMKHAIGARAQTEFLARFERYKQDMVEAADRNASRQNA